MNDTGRAVINRLAGRPKCPICNKQVDCVLTDIQVHIYYEDGIWVRRENSGDNIFECSKCHEEFSPEDLDALGIPNEVRQ